MEIRVLGNPVGSPASPLRDDVVDAVTKAVHVIHPDIPIIPQMSSGATDGMHIRAAGIPTYGVGGVFMREDDRFSHGLNERVPVRAFYDALEIWHMLLVELAGPQS